MAPDSRVETSSWQPFFSLSGDLANRDHMSFSADRSRSKSVNFRGGGGGAEDRSQSYRVGLRHTIKAPTAPPSSGGTDMSFRLRSDIDINLDGTLQRQVHEIQLTGSQAAPAPQRTTRFDIGATAGYTFANNVRGSLQTGYTRNFNSQSNIISHSVRLLATASLSF